MITLGSLFDGIRRRRKEIQSDRERHGAALRRFRDREVSGSIEEGAIACILVSL